MPGLEPGIQFLSEDVDGRASPAMEMIANNRHSMRATLGWNDGLITRILGPRPYRLSVENVSQSFSDFASMPFLNQRTRCSLVPWVKLSGTA